MKGNTKYYHFIIAILIALVLFGFERYKTYQQEHSILKNANRNKVEEVIRTSHVSNRRNNHPSDIPQKAYDVWNYVRGHHQPMEGYVGGREFKNYEHLLESKASDGHRIHYQEWDVNPKREGHHRGTERLITSDEDRAWYTSNHYQSFTELK